MHVEASESQYFHIKYWFFYLHPHLFCMVQTVQLQPWIWWDWWYMLQIFEIEFRCDCHANNFRYFHSEELLSKACIMIFFLLFLPFLKIFARMKKILKFFLTRKWLQCWIRWLTRQSFRKRTQWKNNNTELSTSFKNTDWICPCVNREDLHPRSAAAAFWFLRKENICSSKNIKEICPFDQSKNENILDTRVVYCRRPNINEGRQERIK